MRSDSVKYNSNNRGALYNFLLGEIKFQICDKIVPSLLSAYNMYYNRGSLY